MASTHRGVIPHLPALDGLRGVAVIGVVLFHANGLLKGGYLGVDLFFVLSGYLITSILIAERAATGAINLAQFWVRRARRLFPALLSIMPAIALYAWRLALPDELKGLRYDALATLGYVANWRAIFSSKSYWDLFVAPSPLEHTWSLAIEEQFYVVWPLLFWLVMVKLARPKRVMLGVTVVLLVLSMAAMLVLFDPDRTSRVYFGTDTRAAAILSGAALSMVLDAHAQVSQKLARVFDVLGAIALGLLGYAWCTLEGQSELVYRGGLWLTELGGLVLVACAVAGTDKSYVARLFALRPLAYMGTISYGVYLWHWPIDCVLTPERTHVTGLPLQAVRMGLTLVIAVLSDRFFERPIRTKGLPFGHPLVVAIASFAVAGLLVFRATAPRPFSPTPLPEHATLPQVGSEAGQHEYPGPYSVSVDALPPSDLLRPGSLRVLVLGDSVAEKLGVALRHRQDEARVFLAQRGVGNCSILTTLTVNHIGGGPPANDSHNCAASWTQDVAELEPDATLIVLGGGYFAKMKIDGKTEFACDAGWHEAYRARLIELVDAMGPSAGQVILTLVPYPMDRWRYDHVLDWVDCFNAILREVAEIKHLPTIDLAKHICPDRDCILESDGYPIRPDGLHPDGKGAEECSRWTLSEINRVMSHDAAAP